MSQTSPVKLWAIIAPLAALAGLAWTFYKRKKSITDSSEDDGQTVRKVTGQIDPKRSRRPKPGLSEPPKKQNEIDEISAKDVEMAKLIDDEIDQEIRKSESEEKIESSEINRVEALPKNLEEKELEKNFTEPEVREDRADSGFKTAGPSIDLIEDDFSEPVKTPSPEPVKPESPTSEELRNEPSEIEPTVNGDVKNEPLEAPETDQVSAKPLRSQVVNEYDQVQSDHSDHAVNHEESLELIEVETAPAQLMTSNFENSKNLSHVMEPESEVKTIEEPERSYDIISENHLGDLGDLDQTTNSEANEERSQEVAPADLSTIQEITESQTPSSEKGTEEKIVESEPERLECETLEFELETEMKPQGQSGSIIDNLLRRERTESERIQGDDWTQSPKPMKLTPVFKERSTKETPSRKKDKKSKNTQRKASNSKAQKDEYERDSTTTPDSVKDNQNSRPSPPKERRKKKRSGKKGRKASDKQNSSSNTNEELLEGTSSDSGTATDDTVNYMEISGFPPEMIGALIGKKGKNIQNIQTQSRCKILVKDYPVENGGQYIAIEGSRNNINKALKILREKFPDIKLSHLETFTGPAAETPTEPQNGVEPLQYDYDSYYSGSINNTSDTLELVEGVPVEVRVTSMGLTFNELWLQPYTHPSKDLFDRLETNMSDFYNRDTQLSVLESYLELGAYAMCLHHSPDELTGKELPKWYRVQVVQYPDDHHAMVLFLDFGGYASVPIEMLRKIMHEFLPGPSNVPFQAVHAELAGLQVLPNEQDKLPDIAMKLHDIICKVPRNSLEAQVVRYDFEKDQPLVKLFYQQNGQRIMVNEVFAQHCSHIEFKEI